MIKPKTKIKNASVTLSRQMVIREQLYKFKQKKLRKSLTRDIEKYTSMKNY